MLWLHKRQHQTNHFDVSFTWWIFCWKDQRKQQLNSVEVGSTLRLRRGLDSTHSVVLKVEGRFFFFFSSECFIKCFWPRTEPQPLVYSAERCSFTWSGDIFPLSYLIRWETASCFQVVMFQNLEHWTGKLLILSSVHRAQTWHICLICLCECRRSHISIWTHGWDESHTRLCCCRRGFRTEAAFLSLRCAEDADCNVQSEAST